MIKVYTKEKGLIEAEDSSDDKIFNLTWHREDGPAYEDVDNYKQWYINDQLHRIDGPAIEYADGRNMWFINDNSVPSEWLQNNIKDPLNITKEEKVLMEITWGKNRNSTKQLVTYEHPDGTKVWYKYGYLHRTDGPAIELSDGTKQWFKDGEPHRLNGPAIESADGIKKWYLNGKPHRLNGPAIEGPDGIKAWYKDGKRHRLDGPAIEDLDGTKEWWLNGDELSIDWINENIMDPFNITEAEQILIKLTWC